MTDDSAVAAHAGIQGHRYLMHFPAHPARAGDPHYADFNAYHKATRQVARCFIGERVGFGDCRDAQGNLVPPPAVDKIASVLDSPEQPGLELHHAHVEFSLQNGVSLAALEKDYPGISDPAQVGAWVESGANFRWLCVAEGSPVLMADGSATPIEYVVPGDHVIGKDGRPHLVTASSRKRYRGEVVSFGAAAFTPEHRLLGRGWWPAAAEIIRQVSVHGPEVIPLGGEQHQVGAGVVGAVSVEVVDSLLGKERPAYPLLHDQDVLHDVPGSGQYADIALRGDLRRPVADVPLRQLVQFRHPAVVGAEPSQVGAGAPVRGTVEGRFAGLAAPQMAWVTAVPRRASFTGWVHDLSVAHSHSFIAGGIVAHNCAWHHRGASGAHVAAHADWEASQYILGLITAAT